MIARLHRMRAERWFMKRIMYYAACSLDGYVAGRNGDIGMFIRKGSAADHYRRQLETFDTVIMCRQTYEFGYGYGLKAGQPTCDNMKHYIFSNSLKFDAPHPDVQVRPPSREAVAALKEGDGPDIYLCGGGPFAGWLLEWGLIDVLKLRVNPVILGGGAPLFGHSQKSARFDLVRSIPCDYGVVINEYKILPPPPAEDEGTLV